jgi:transposase
MAAKWMKKAKKNQGEVGTMARSLIRQVESLWLFLDIVEVDPTNNHAERTLRYGVI